LKKIIYWIIFIFLIVAYVTDIENIDLKNLFSLSHENTTSYDK